MGGYGLKSNHASKIIVRHWDTEFDLLEILSGLMMLK